MSQEPATPSASNVRTRVYVEPVKTKPLTCDKLVQDIDPTPRARKDSNSRTPLKKNRRRLDPTQEEEDGNGSGSRSGSGSPPHTAPESPRQQMKIKVRQISRGVDKINWKSMEAIPANDDKELVDQIEADDDAIIEEAETQSVEEEKINEVGMVDDDETLPKTPEESPLTQFVQDLRNEDSMMAPATPEVARLRAGSDSNDKGLKRKFLERGTSHGPPEHEAVQPAPEPLKRHRDENDKDPNPRETKRPTPPPSPSQDEPVPKMVSFYSSLSTF